MPVPRHVSSLARGTARFDVISLVRGRARFDAPAIFAVFALAGLMAAAWPFTIDDAFIVARYADRIARGRGYTFVGGAASDGVTGPLWLAPLALGAYAGLDPVRVAKWGGALASALALAWVVVRLRRRARGHASAWLASLTAVSSLPFVIWSVAGLENGAAALAVTALSLAVSERPRPRSALAGIACAALVWLRPELVPFAAVWLVALALRGWQHAAPALVLALFGVLSVIAFRLALFGHALPMSAGAKPALLPQGAGYVAAALSRPRAWFAALAVVSALKLAGREGATLACALAVHLGAVALAGGDWMPGRRLFASVLPVLALAVALGISRLTLRRPWLGWALFTGLLASSCFELVPELFEARRAGLTRAQRAPALARLVCAARGPVAAVDIGLLGYACPDQTFLDLGGLTEPAIAYARGVHLDKQLDGAWLHARAPGLLVLHSRERPRVDERGHVRWFAGYPIERRVLSLPFVQRDYAATHVLAYAPSYFYVLLAPRVDARAGPRERNGGVDAREHDIDPSSP